VFINPENFQTTPAYDLFVAVGRGLAGFDHRVIHALVDEPARTLPDILRFALEDRSVDRVDLEEELLAIFRHLRAPEALPFYIDFLRKYPEEDVSDEIMSALREIGEPAIGPLLELYEELGEEQAGEVGYILSSFRLRDERILKLLLDRLEYDVLDGMLLLGFYGDPAARPAIEKLLAGIADEDPSASTIRAEADFALGHFDAPHQEAFPEPESIWSQYPETASPLFSILHDDERIALMDSSSEDYRAAAVRHFFNRDLEKPLCDRIFQMARQDPSVHVRSRCWETLGSAVDDKSVRAAILEKLNDETAPLEERCGALVGLAFESDDEAVRSRLLEFYARPETRAKALEAMWRSLDRRFAEYVPGHLDDSDPEVKRNAIWCAGYFGMGAEAARLRACFEDEEFRSDALFAYALSVPAELSRGRARGLVRKIEDAAGGLSQDELELVQMALDERLALHGLEPVFAGDEIADEEIAEHVADELPALAVKAGRNDPCPCGSGKKYKKCCGA
jgi:hypothetical protein